MSIQSRLDSYFKFSSELASLSTDKLMRLLRQSTVTQGWGHNHVVTLSGKKFFVKRIPLTALENELPFSTKNHFNLPVYYNYGVGSAGFGAFRELISYIKTTNWVLNGASENFPLLYHYRIVARSGRSAAVDRHKHREYVKYWGNSRAIGQYVLARKKAAYEIILCLEYFPFTLRSWLFKNSKQFAFIVRDMKESTRFLQTQGMMHFDLHLANILTDGKRGYITDFGLCMDTKFEFSKSERLFFNKHQDKKYDYTAFIGALGYSLYEFYTRLSQTKKNKIAKRFGFASSGSPAEILPILVQNLKTIKSMKCLNADDRFLDFLYKNRYLILAMRSFFSQLRVSRKKSPRYYDFV